MQTIMDTTSARDRRQAALLLDLIALAEADVDQGGPADQALAQAFRRHREFGARDRRLYAQGVFAWFRWRGWLSLVDGPAGLKAAGALALDASVPSPLVPALLAEAGYCGAPWPAAGASLAGRAASVAQWLGLPRPPPWEALAPRWLERALFYPGAAARRSHYYRCVAAFQQRPPTWLRVATPQQAAVRAHLEQAGCAVEPHPTLAGALAVTGPFNVHAIPAALRVEVQDLASQAVGRACAPQPGERWLDLCAGSGGKALHLADLMQQRGQVTATDIRPAILEGLRRRARLAGCTIIRTMPVADLPAADRDLYDGVLVDAPCSGLGTWSRNPDARWRTLESVVIEKSQLQSQLLASAAARVKPGGVLVYSVCTVTRAETVGVLHRFLYAHPDFALAGVNPDAPAWIWPWDGPCNGMFIARMARRG